MYLGFLPRFGGMLGGLIQRKGGPPSWWQPSYEEPSHARCGHQQPRRLHSIMFRLCVVGFVLVQRMTVGEAWVPMTASTPTRGYGNHCVAPRPFQPLRRASSKANTGLKGTEKAGDREKAAKKSKPRKASAATSGPAATRSKKRSSPRAKTTTKKKSSRTKKAKDNLPPPFWGNQSNPVLVHRSDDNEGNLTYQEIIVKVQGNPLPLRRHRTYRGFVYNPSADAQACFRDVVEDLLVRNLLGDVNNNQTNSTHSSELVNPDKANSTQLEPGSQNATSLFPLFGNDTALGVVLVFSTKRPKAHFVASTPGRPLKAKAPPVHYPTRTDVDNLAKFVLDSMNGLLYGDDHQISSLQVTRLLDNEGHCLGSTVMRVFAINDENHLHSAVQNTLKNL